MAINLKYFIKIDGGQFNNRIWEVDYSLMKAKPYGDKKWFDMSACSIFISPHKRLKYKVLSRDDLFLELI